MFIAVPKRFNFDALSINDIHELIKAKIVKEANRYIHNWPDEKISVENARWGPVIKFGKKVIKLPKKTDGNRYSAEELSSLSIDDVKKMIEAGIPNAFGKKKAPKAVPVESKKPAAKKKVAPKKKK